MVIQLVEFSTPTTIFIKLILYVHVFFIINVCMNILFSCTKCMCNNYILFQLYLQFTTLIKYPLLREVLKAKNSLKNNKATGPDGPPGEIFKYGRYAVTRCLYEFILEIWDAEILPQQWIDPDIVTIYKRKGGKSDCSNYRGISLLSVAGKILARILLSRLLDSVAGVILPESQCGFHRGRSTIDMIFVARLLQEKCREQHKDLYLAFIDLTKKHLILSAEKSCGMCCQNVVALLSLWLSLGVFTTVCLHV